MTHLLDHKDAITIINLLKTHGYETRFIGGCVRDSLLNRPLGDIDLATNALPDQTMTILSGNGIKVIPTGIKHGTVTAVLNQSHFEITTLRKDVDTDGRHAIVEFSDSWEQDAQRRDFTINALSVDSDGKIHDYCDGQSDLAAKRLRFIGDATARIHEDYLRILRFFRFAAVLDWPIEDNADMQACISLSPKLSTLSRERIQSELYKLMLAPGAERIVDILAKHTILLPHFDVKRFQNVITMEISNQDVDAFRRVIALIGWKNTHALEKIIVLTRDDKKRLELLNKISTSSEALEAMLYYLGKQTVTDFYYLSENNLDYQFIQSWQKPVFPLKAEPLMAASNLTGPALGERLQQAERHWVDHKFKPDADELLDLFK